MARRAVFLLPWFAATLTVATTPRGYGIPGTTQTQSGYDTELGTDAMCWTSKGSILDSGNIAFSNALVANFGLIERVQLLDACPQGNELSAAAPLEFGAGTRFRTQMWYNYTVNLELNATSLAADQNVSDFSLVSDEGPRVAVQIMACELGKAGFCSPFKHEEANARLAAENKTEDLKQGDSHGGTHIHSGYHFVDLPSAPEHLYSHTLNVPMIVNSPGTYFLIASLQLFFRDSTGGFVRFDVANALPINQRVLEFVEPPKILAVSRQTQNLLLFANGFVTFIIGALLWQTIRHRNHQIMTLTQGNFLIVFLVAAMVVTSASSMFDPQNTFDCQFGGPVVLVSAQLMFSVMLGRLWRINSVISPLLAQTLRSRQRSSSFSLFRGKSATDTKNLRKTVNWEQVATRVVLFLVPQVLIQLGAVSLQPAHTSIRFNADETVGWPHCARDAPTWLSFSFYGYVCFLVLVLILLATAYQTSNLPSLFNETRDIFDSTLGTVVVLVLGVGILQVAKSSNASPEIDLLIRAALILTGTLNATIRVVVPKLRMIWRGETVLVSKLMSDHKQRVQTKDMLYLKQRTQKMPGHQSDKSSRCTSNDESIDFFRTEEALDDCVLPTNKLVVKRNEAPGKRLVLKLFTAQNLLTKVTERIISGSVVPEEDWIQLRRMSRSLSHMFHHEVEFFWERKLHAVDEEYTDEDVENAAITEIPAV